MAYNLTLTDALRDTLLEILDNDVTASGYDIPDYRDHKLMKFFLLRAKLISDLQELAQ
tara:strand:- start:525 stop:698 length:174 start_codon:yes stop_codon:yes gene_type:complete